jgi:hypothetical protein
MKKEGKECEMRDRNERREKGEDRNERGDIGMKQEGGHRAGMKKKGEEFWRYMHNYDDIIVKKQHWK